MFQATRVMGCVAMGALIWLSACSAEPGKAPPGPKMPTGWKVVSDFDVPSEQTKDIGRNLGVHLGSLRNTLYEVRGMKVQLNILIVPDNETGDRLMTKLRTMKGKEALLRAGLIIYEFVGANETLPIIAEGRQHLESL